MCDAFTNVIAYSASASDNLVNVTIVIVIISPVLKSINQSINEITRKPCYRKGLHAMIALWHEHDRGERPNTVCK